MSSLDSKGRYPQDIVAIFHASFHPTQGNIIDWSLKANDDLSLEHLEFSALPSGLHLVEEDVVYFTKDGQHGVCVFRRRKTVDHGHRGFRLSSLGILLAKSARPRPWRHTAALKELTTLIYSRFESSASLVPTENDWDPARAFFNERKVTRADLGGAGDWNGWSHELLERLDDTATNQNPTLHLPHLLRILGPSSLTLYKHAVGRRRILIYTLPPVEAASILCQVAADMCYEQQVEYTGAETSASGSQSRTGSRLHPKHKEGISVLGMITLNDLDRLQSEEISGRGWVACTTDAIFLEKPSCYDLLIDLTTSTPNKATRPTFYSSRPVPPPPAGQRARGPTHRLSVVRFSWSDVKLWNELNRILSLDASSAHEHHACCAPGMSPDAAQNGKSSASPITAWTDAWRVYEDVCVICAGLWMGGWRGNSTASYSTAGGAANWGAVRLEGDEDLSLRALGVGVEGSSGTTIGGHVRSVGMGIEGGPKVSGSTGLSRKSTRRSSGMSWSSGRATVTGSSLAKGKGLPATADDEQEDEDLDDGEEMAEAARGQRDGQILTTLSLLQTLHAHTSFQLSTLERFLPASTTNHQPIDNAPGVIALSSKDMSAFELGPMSGMDARYLEWIASEYGGGAAVVIKRGWKEMLGAIFGYS
ncbi:hypothetical protein B0H16DRAFT_1411336 [Mycena metata]|uniref:Protein LCHN n=1 Tax=Mycena metata TaxID=1033252 RepID=A0AAD7JPS7_9AGAR|nr:hypothetical protein B0H16DRAFT_1411336 [Mycena metata]